jgi:glyoxylase-like metal-dependent hydrolase (beta-lactamase superfamily II)
MGDDMWTGRFPFVDLSSGGSVQGLERNIGQLLKKIPADAKLIPGHGPLSTPADLKEFHEMLKEVLAMVRGKMDQGKSLEEIQKEGVPERWSEWGSGYIKTDVWLQTVHESLSAGD